MEWNQREFDTLQDSPEKSGETLNFTPKVNYVVDECIDADALWRQYDNIDFECLDLGDALYTFGANLKTPPKPEDITHLYTKTDYSNKTIGFYRLQAQDGETVVLANAILYQEDAEFSFSHKDERLRLAITRAIGVHLTLGREDSPLLTLYQGKEANGLGPSRVVITEEASDFHRLCEEQRLQSKLAASAPQPKVKRPKRQRTAPLNAEHRALLERVKQARKVAANTKNKEPAPIVYILIHPREPDCVKIGSCQDPDERLSKYQTGCPRGDYRYARLEYCQNGRVVEEYLKLQQATVRLRGEWYRLTVEQATEIVKQAIIACAD